jgi:uncharacterized membrane protein YeiB
MCINIYCILFTLYYIHVYFLFCVLTVYVVISSLCLIFLADKSSVILYDYTASLFSTSCVGVGLELEVVLRPTDSRPVHLGIGPPLGAHDLFFVICFV